MTRLYHEVVRLAKKDEHNRLHIRVRVNRLRDDDVQAIAIDLAERSDRDDDFNTVERQVDYEDVYTEPGAVRAAIRLLDGHTAALEAHGWTREA